MVNPAKMCDKHLLGEHVECHMFAGALLINQNISGYIKNNCFEGKSLFQRHDEIVLEMKKRGMNHRSPLSEHPNRKEILEKISEYPDHSINRKVSEKELFSRCKKCKERKIL